MLSVLEHIFYSYILYRIFVLVFYKSYFHFFAYYHFCTYFWCLLHSHTDGVITAMKNTTWGECANTCTLLGVGNGLDSNEKYLHLALLLQGTVMGLAQLYVPLFCTYEEPMRYFDFLRSDVLKLFSCSRFIPQNLKIEFVLWYYLSSNDVIHKWSNK